MAHHVETTVRVNAPAAKVWETLRDFTRHHGKHNRLRDAFCSSPRCGRGVKPLEHQATAALQHLASDPRSVVACQEGHRFGDILGPAEATERRLSNHAVEHFLR